MWLLRHVSEGTKTNIKNNMNTLVFFFKVYSWFATVSCPIRERKIG